MTNKIMPSSGKQQTRHQLKAQRRLLDKNYQCEAARKITSKLNNMPLYQECRHIALYYAVNGEVDPLALMPHKQDNRIFYLPIITSGNSLLFAKFDQHSQYQTNKYGIPEPVYNPQQLMTAESLDLICIPLLAFDENRNRLGMGAGYYDRTLAFRQAQTKPYCIGLAYEFQKVDAIDAENWDIPMDCIITDVKIYSSPFIESENLP